MAAITLGNLIAAAAPNELVLLAARLVEGVGFLALCSPFQHAGPGRQARAAGLRDGGVDAYMPAGIMLTLFLGPGAAGHRLAGLWIAKCLAARAAPFVAALHAPVIAETARESAAARFFTEAANVVAGRAALVLAVAFFAYSSRFLARILRCRSC